MIEARSMKSPSANVNAAFKSEEVIVLSIISLVSISVPRVASTVTLSVASAVVVIPVPAAMVNVLLSDIV